MTLLTVKDLKIAFWQRAERKTKELPQTVVHGVSFELQRGRSACLLGQSGSGKTVTARAIAGALMGQPGVTGGVVEHHGDHPVTLYGIKPRRDPEPLNSTLLRAHRMGRKARRQMNRLKGARPALIFQNSQTALSPFWTVNQILVRAQVRAGAHRQDAESGCGAYLQRVGFEDPTRFLNRYPFELSGGEAKRIAIAVALARAPALVMADEPTTGLDAHLRLAIRDQFAALIEGGASLLLITHGIGLFADLVDDVYVMFQGRVVEQGPARTLIQDAKHPYTRRLLRAELSVGSASLAPTETAIKSAPGGCAYRVLCDVYPRLSEGQQASCRQPVPLVQIDDSKVRCTVARRA